MRILLVHQDTRVLLALSQALRGGNVTVAIASNAAMATERAGIGEYDAVLVSRMLAEATHDGLGVIDALALELASPPPIVVLATPGTEPSPSEVHEDDARGILAKLAELPVAERARSSLAPSSFSARRTPIAALLMAFADEGRSGTLTVTTPSGRAIACLLEGRLVDVLFGRHQGEKALARLVALKDGNTEFSPGDPGVLARLDQPTIALVARAGERAEAFGMLTARFDVPLESVYYMQSASFTEGDDRGLASRILDRLRGPASLAHLIDDLAPPDVEILGALVALEATGHVRRVGTGGLDERAPLASHEDIQQLRAAASKARGRGYTGLARIVIAGTPSKLAALSQVLLGIVEAVAPDEPPPALPLPHPLAELRLGEGVAVEILGLPLVPAYAPLWTFAVSGAHAVIALESSHEALEEACASTARNVHSARSLMPSFDPSRPPDVAALLRAALEIG